MPERSFVARLRASGGPSHELLVLLDQHRVMTTGQLARATTTPERTVRYRLDRLHGAGLVGHARPGRESGSAPRHWWLRPAGARIVTGTAAAEGSPSGLFVTHAATIAEVWLALREHGPAAGIEVTGWAADRAGWQEWPGPGYGGTRRLTPDALLHARATSPDAGVTTAAATAAFIEVDLASMTQTLLRQKVARYLAYATDRAWAGHLPHCPPLLLLTTTATRAAGFVRAAGKLLAAEQRHYRLRSTAEGDIAHAEALVVAACGLVRDPARAVAETCWDAARRGRRRGEPGRAAGRAGHRAGPRRCLVRPAGRRPAPAGASGLAVGGPPLRALARTAGPARSRGARPPPDPDLADAVLAWWRDGAAATAVAGPVRAPLRDRHRRLWVEHARALLATTGGGDLADADPRLSGYAARLQDGRLLRSWELEQLRSDPPARSRRQVQQDALGDYPASRGEYIAEQHRQLPWLTRRRTSPAALAEAHDHAQLLVCDTCAILTPRPDPDHDHWYEADSCRHCGAGALLDYEHRDRVPTLAQRLGAIRSRLHRGTRTGPPS